MKDSICVSCKYYARKHWSTYHIPRSGFHPIGIPHVHGFCLKHSIRCSMVKKCEVEKE